MSERGLAAGFAGLVCDLDGVVYAGRDAIAHAVASLDAVRPPIVFATNNASRTPADVAAHLRTLGVRLEDASVLTSSLAAARVLVAELGPGAHVLAIGGEGVGAALRGVGLVPLQAHDTGRPVAVLQGFGSGVTAADLGEAAHAIRAGARWVATNDDLTLPTERGPAPGNGSLVAAVRQAVDVDPEVIGKPHPGMYVMAAETLGVKPAQVLAVGDRLETDIEGAVAAGMRAALVLTGVHGPADAAAAPPHRRPDYILEDLRGLACVYPRGWTEDGWAWRGDARARVDGDLRVDGVGIDAVRASLDAVWAAVDDGQITPEVAGQLVATG